MTNNTSITIPEDRTVPIHTSDTGLFKSCRRRWLWGSHLNRGLEPVYKAPPLWFGEAIHSAMKDFHGPRLFDSVIDSFHDYVKLSYEHHYHRLPDEADELVNLGYGMLQHYEKWLERRDPYTTFEFEGRLQVESGFEIDLPVDPALLKRIDKDRVVYRGTFDRVIIDENGHLHILDYKTAKIFNTSHLPVDPQVSRYMWAASRIYHPYKVVGFIYQQHKKAIPKPARILQSGHVSEDKSQTTTHSMYRAALIKTYGDSPSGWTEKQIGVLNKLAMAESYDRDNFIERTKITRNQIALENEYKKIMLEVHDMLSPDTAMYPSQGWGCGMCSFISPCNSMDDGSDWEYELNDTDVYVQRKKASSEWELLSYDRLGGVLYRANAGITHDSAGQPIANPNAASASTIASTSASTSAPEHVS